MNVSFTQPFFWGCPKIQKQSLQCKHDHFSCIPVSGLVQFNSYNFRLGLPCPTRLCIFGSERGPSHLSWLCSVDSGSKLVLSAADTQSCPGCAVAWYAQAHVCVCVCVWDMGWRWEALPPILLLLKSSHERSCQELQCGLSGPSQGQSRLQDATHTLPVLTHGAASTVTGGTELDDRTGRGDHEEAKWGKQKRNGVLKTGCIEGQRRRCLQNPKFREGVMHRFCRKEERNCIQ